MVVYLCDSSDFDWDRGSFDVAAMVADGIIGLTAKATEATNVRHVHLADALDRGRAAGLAVLGAYHVVRSAPSVAAQVAYFFAHLDSAVPWWRTWPGFLLQVDLEKWSYDNLSPSTGIAFAQALRAAKPASAFVIVYASKGQYGDGLAGIGSPLWNANYPSSRSAPYRSLYPGDSGIGWTTYSGQAPMFWQFASTATIGNQSTCDINAYRGTLDQLLQTIGATDMALTSADASLVATAVWNQLLGPKTAQTTAANTLTDTADQVGSGKSRYDGATGFMARALIAQAASNANTSASLATLSSAIQSMAAVLQQGGGNPDIAPLVADVVALSAQVAALQADLDATQAALAQAAQVVATNLSGH